MIRFVLTRGLEYALEGLGPHPQPSRFTSMNYDQLIRVRRLRAATTIFTDLDRLSYADRELAGRLYLEMKERGQRVLNNPARFKNRDILLRDLHQAGLNDFRACRADQLLPSLHFPVFVRRIQGHAPPSDLLRDVVTLQAHLEGQVGRGIPLEHLLVIEFVGEHYRPGIYRKLGIFRIGEETVPSICGWDDHWIVKAGKNELATEACFREELCLMQENPHREHFLRVFDLAGVEYGRADFGFLNGKIQVYEVNTLPAFVRYASYPSPLREETIRIRREKLRAAFDKIESRDAAAFRFDKHTIPRRNRGWRALLNRTRQVD